MSTDDDNSPSETGSPESTSTASANTLSTGVEDNGEPVLELENISVEFKEEPLIEQAMPQSIVDRFDLGEDPVQAVSDVSIELGEEDVLVLLGESGSGKTTLGRTAIGIQEPTEGTVKYRGYDVQDVEDGRHSGEIYYEDVRRALQIVHQDSNAALNPYRTIRATLSEPLKLWFPDLDVNDRNERILSMLRTTGVTPAEDYMDRYPHELSGGEQQRVAIIRAMLVEPDVILADEVVSALDVSLRIDIMDLLVDLQEMFSTSYIFISHNLTNARYFAEKTDGKIAVVYLGEIVEIGTPEEVIENPKHPYTQILRWASLPLDPVEARETITEPSPVMTEEAPDPSDPPSGCRFHPSCPKAREACTREDPELVSEEGSPDHLSACFREDSTHEYWQSEPLHGEEHEIPER
ncbi:ABC transporter ATP-binding protein [Halomontanus rarus]|uniref:ABC transporter ATP-binding protein n=1 Tax=Halomontanus rarus TaxID=3034020 RepID=UPI0023E8C25C|nr:oligopeptide/dipeptide ABC transporter ATP-binding protein [Halovivax sp. TS33]